MGGFFCGICRNERVTQHDAPCAACTAQVIEGPLADAYRHWVKLGEQWRRCCGGLSYDSRLAASADAREHGHLFFHGRHFEGTHEGLWVEYGASFYADHARTYYNRDFDHSCDSEEYGGRIPYADPDFWSKLEAQLDEAPKAAFEAGLMSCEECGHHFVDEPCCVRCPDCKEPMDRYGTCDCKADESHGFRTTDGTTWTRPDCRAYVERTDANERGHDDARPYRVAWLSGEPTGEGDVYERFRTLRNAVERAAGLDTQVTTQPTTTDKETR